MTRLLAACAGAVAALTATAAHADDDGFIGRRRVALEIDDCPPQPGLSPAEIKARGADHYDRGLVLYLQGDYPGSIAEFVSAYCLAPLPSLLKDIGQSYERSVRFERAITYFERYVMATNDPVGRENIVARIQVGRGNGFHGDPF